MKLTEIKNTKPKREFGDISALKASIADVGLINPITTDQHGNLLAGGRRYKAITELGWEEVEVRIIPVNGDMLKAFRVTLDENLKRKSLTDPEVASAIKEYDELKRKLEGSAPEQGGRPKTGHTVTGSGGWSYQKTADDLSISKPAVIKAIKVATAVEEHPELASKKGEQILRTLQVEAQQERIEKLEPITDIYEVIVIDPPWQIAGAYDPDGRRIANPYPTMATEEIMDIEVPSADDCILWLWVTNLNMHDGLHLLGHWEFELKNILTWAKDKFGIGNWLRGQTEHCLLAVKGKPMFRGESVSTLLEAPRTSHSTKPDAFYGLVEQTCIMRKPFLDYFGTSPREGWVIYGSEP